MVFKLIDGKKLAEKVRNRLKLEVANLKKSPKLVVVLVGDNPASQIYVKNKEKYAGEVGIKSEVIRLASDVKQEKLLRIIKKLNKDKKVNGILVQLPLPKHIDEFDVINAIAPEKDVDGFTVYNKGLLSVGKPSMVPCTPLGIMEMFKEYKVKLDGKLAVVVGRSNIVGKPMAQLLLNNNATVIQCHSKTKNLSDITSKADILISAVGKKKLITEKYVKDKAVVIDVAMVRDEKNKKWVGDVDFEKVSKKASLITPVPGGVGPMTIAMLLQNTITAYKKQNRK
ncbi:MAG: bifunctional methylenetetrahydrofolate dehydrogenase/methenyltetrahydrofolate cyclohydrolase FolD [Alphaproteobacteria bacterium]|nr:bifunctional methylenetetrahydrofolate dehydrogenase/methenyltetrahydrofolate cyclohydrolase FolD [Alphaproteobacteria bacterium]